MTAYAAICNEGNLHKIAYRLAQNFLIKTAGFQTTSYSNSSISKFRIGDYQQLQASIDSYLSNHNTVRKCILCCPFISKNEIAQEFDNLKAGRHTRGHIPQLFWIISSFVHSAKDLNVVPVIYCSE